HAATASSLTRDTASREKLELRTARGGTAQQQGAKIMTTDNITRRPRRPERVIKLLVKGMVILIEVANDLTDVLEEAYSAAEAEGWAPEERERWRAALEKARCEVIGAARVKGRVAMLRRERRIASQEERQLALAEALPGLAKVLHDLAD